MKTGISHAVIVGALVATSLVATSTEAQATPARPGPNTVATGKVLKDGAPVVGATLTARIWPSEESLLGLPNGAAVDVRTVSIATTDTAGQYVLNVDWSTIPASFIDRNGTADVEVVADDGLASVQWTLPVVPAPALGATVASIAPASGLAAVTGSTPNILTFDLGSHPGVGDQRASAVPHVGRQQFTPTGLVAVPRSSSLRVGSRSTAKVETLESLAVVPLATCSTSAGTITTNLQERWGRIFAWSGTDTTVTNTDGNSHTLGVGLKVNSGAWGADGSVSIAESSSDSGEESGIKDSWISNRMNYRDYTTKCPATSRTEIRRKPYSTYAQLTDFAYAGHPTWSSCVIKTSGTWTKSTETNTTVSGGMNIGVLAVNAQAGWNSSTKLTWVVKAKSKFCGSSSLGPSGSAEASMSAG